MSTAPPTAARWSRRLLTLLAFNAVWAGSAVAAPTTQPASRPAHAWSPEEFPIGFWCAPPAEFTTLERYREIAEAGFTFVTPPCAAAPPELGRKMLDLAQETGLKVFVGDRRMPHAVTGVPDAEARLDAIVQAYHDHPALAGYSVVDEPRAAQFDGLAEVVDGLRRRDPEHVAFINLFPTYAGAALGTPDYPTYLREFLRKVRPFTLSYDHYHFTKNGDGPHFIMNLAMARQASQEAGVPFWNIVLVTEHGHYRNLTEAELRYEAMQTLAYGAKGLLWFTYWEPDDASFQWTHAMIHRDGTRDPHYDMVKRINWDVRRIGKHLLNAESTAVYHTGPTPEGAQAQPADAPVRITNDTPATVGLFETSDGQRLAFIASANYTDAASADVAIETDAGEVEQYDPAAQAWKPIGASPSFTVELAPGGGVLLRW